MAKFLLSAFAFVIVATAAALFTVSCGGAEEEAGGGAATAARDTASPSPSPSNTEAKAPPSRTPLSSEDIERALAEDAAKPRAQGYMGPFLVTLGEWAERPSCDQFHEPVSDVTQSELYFGMPVDEWVERCPDGTVLSVGIDPAVGRRYFVGEPKVGFAFAPAERVKLTTVAGFPAIVAEPFPGLPAGPAALVVLERSPTESRPGIMLFIEEGTSVDGMVALAKRMLS